MNRELLNFTTLPPGIQGRLTTPWSETEQINTVIIAVVITILVVSLLCLAGLMFRYVHLQKGSYITNEDTSDEEDVAALRIEEVAKGTKPEYFM